MDPISIATAAGTASKSLYSISTTLYTFISSAKKVDKSLEALLNEVKAMARALDSVQSVLKQPLILRTKAEIPVADRVWTSTASAIGDTQKTARILQALVQSLGTLEASPNVFRKAYMQIKINFNSKDIHEIRTLCQSHFNSLNVSLHLVTILIHFQSHDESKIVSELNDLKKLVKDGQLDSDPEGFHALEAKFPEELKNTDMLLHTQQLKRAAESVIDVASSVIDSQSVLGTRLSEANPDSFAYSSELMPGDSASNVGPGRDARKADDGIKEWLTGLKIDETKYEITLKGEATSEHNDALQQGSNRSNDSVGRLPSLPGSPDATKPGNSSAEQDSLDRRRLCKINPALIAFLQDLVSNGVNLNAQDEEGLTAMHWASREGHLAFVKFFYERGADINLKSNEGQSALHEAVVTGQTSVVNLLLKHEAADVEQKGGHADTPLLCAARHGRLTTLHALLKFNANLDAKSRQSKTALHLAARMGHSDCVKLLLEAGAPLEAEDSNGHTALMSASFYGHIETIKLLLKAGARPDSKSSLDGGGPLQYSAQVGHGDCTRLLLDAGASIEGKNSNGFTALMVASKHGHGEVVELLLKAGAKVDAQNNGRSSLMYAAKFGHKEVIDLLLAAGAQIRARGRYGQTVLFYVMRKHPDDCNQSECSFCSGRETRKDIMKYVCTKGADVSAINDDGHSLLKTLPHCDHIDQDERKEIKKVLRRFGAK